MGARAPIAHAHVEVSAGAAGDGVEAGGVDAGGAGAGAGVGGGAGAGVGGALGSGSQWNPPWCIAPGLVGFITTRSPGPQGPIESARVALAGTRDRAKQNATTRPEVSRMVAPTPRFVAHADGVNSGRSSRARRGELAVRYALCVCRYGSAAYKEHYACFACRKSWKPLRAAAPGTAPPSAGVCPECAGPTAAMGLDFQPPRRVDRKAWRAVEALYEVGITFRSCGCSGPGYRPRDPALLGAFFRRQQVAYRRALAEAELRVRGGSTLADHLDAPRYWRERIRALEDVASRRARGRGD